MSRAIAAVPRLKITWAAAARLAAEVAPIAAKAAVDVVPILAPITIAPAEYNSIKPLAAAVIVMAIDALDDWVSTVITIPINRYTKIPVSPSALN